MRRGIILALVSICALLSREVRADVCPPASLNVLTNGTTADANAVMGNFNFLLNCMNSGITAVSTVVAVGPTTKYVGILNSVPISELDVGGTITVRGNIFGPGQNSAFSVGADPSFSGAYAQFFGATSSNPGLLVLSAGSAGSISLGAGGSPKMFILPNGNVGIGQGAPGYALHVANGPVAGAGAYVNLSDARLKKDIVAIPYGLNAVLKLRPVGFDWRDQSQEWQRRHQIGLIAQEVEAVVPEAVSVGSDPEQLRSLAYGSLVPVLVKAIQELNERNAKIEVENLEYRRRIDEIERTIAKWQRGGSPDHASLAPPSR